MSSPSVSRASEVDGRSRRELLRVLRRESATSLVDEIIVKVGTDIVEGRLLPGDDLNSVELARAFGTSRTPVREALLTLQREGFVDISAHRRPRVAAVSLDEVRDLYRVRAHLYQMVSRCVVARASDPELAVLREVQDRLRAAAEAGDVDGYFWTNVEFRNTEARICGNETLCRLLDSLGLRMLQLRHLSLSLPGRIERSVEDHERLLLAYSERDADLAAALTASLVLGGLRTIEHSGWVGPER
ncbi:MAG: GntR family transcriptional regulator [Pseudonocardia sp.]|nr:GntR family transcriptional regulator [Pseudonocardia sp.]